MTSPPNKCKAPPKKPKAPLLKTLWRRFWCYCKSDEKLLKANRTKNAKHYDIISHTTECSSLQIHYSASAADTNGKQKIITDWSICKISWLQKLNHHYTFQSKKRLTCHGVAATMSDTNTVQKIQKDKIFDENLISQRQTKKNGQILHNGQMRFFMASAVNKWPNFSKLTMKWPVWQPCIVHAIKYSSSLQHFWCHKQTMDN